MSISIRQSSRMDIDVVRYMIRRRLVERRLPHERMTNVEVTPGGGQMCDACGANVTTDQMAMIGVPPAGGRTRHFHALCFRIWDNERHMLDWLRDVARAEGSQSGSVSAATRPVSAHAPAGTIRRPAWGRSRRG